MGGKKKPKGGNKNIPNTAADSKKDQSVSKLSSVESKVFGFESRDSEPYVNLKYIDTSYQCFSDWEIADLKALSSFIRKITTSNWPEIYRSAGKGENKAGFGYTTHKNRDDLPSNSKLDNISPDITFFELRVTQKARVHGFRAASAFFLVWLDKDHAVYKE